MPFGGAVTAVIYSCYSTEQLPAAALLFNRLQMSEDEVSILLNEKILHYEMALITSDSQGKIWRRKSHRTESLASHHFMLIRIKACN